MSIAVIYALLKHQVKYIIRNIILKTSLAGIIIYSILAIIFFWLSLNAGLTLNKLPAGNPNPVFLFYQIIIWLYFFDLILKLIGVNIMVFPFKPYLCLPVSRSLLYNMSLVGSSMSIYNSISLFIFLPLIFTFYIPLTSFISGLLLVADFIILVLINHYGILLIKHIYFINRKLIWLFLGLILFVVLKYNAGHTNSLMTFFEKSLSNSYSTLILCGILCSLYFTNLLLLPKYLNTSDFYSGKKTSAQHQKSGSLNKILPIISLDLKLILRNRRAYTILINSLIFIVLFAALMLRQEIESLLMKFLIFFLLMNAFTFQYGQFLFSWQGNFFECLNANLANRQKYILSIYLNLMILSGISFLFVLPFCISDLKDIYLLFTILVFNAGFYNYFLILAGLRNRRAIQLNTVGYMNFEGISLFHFILLFPLAALLLTFYFLNAAFGYNYAIIICILLSSTGVFLMKPVCGFLTCIFSNVKYDMIKSFKNN